MEMFIPEVNDDFFQDVQKSSTNVDLVTKYYLGYTAVAWNSYKYIYIYIYTYILGVITIEILLNTVNFASDAERSEASSQESFFPQSNGTFKQRDSSETFFFFDMFFWTKNGSFWTYNWYPWWTGPARPGLARPSPVITLFDASFLNQFKRYRFKFFRQCGYWFYDCRIRFWIKSLR